MPLVLLKASIVWIVTSSTACAREGSCSGYGGYLMGCSWALGLSVEYGRSD